MMAQQCQAFILATHLLSCPEQEDHVKGLFPGKQAWLFSQQLSTPFPNAGRSQMQMMDMKSRARHGSSKPFRITSPFSKHCP